MQILAVILSCRVSWGEHICGWFFDWVSFRQHYVQEGWLSPTERASVSAISLRHIIWLPHESHAVMSLPSTDLRCRHLATSRESKAHFGLPWVRLWDYRGKCYMDGKRIQCLSNASQHVPIYLQPFPSNSSRKFKSSPFWPPLGTPLGQLR